MLQSGAALGTGRGTGQDGSCCQGRLQAVKVGSSQGCPGLSCRAAPAALRALCQARASATCQGQLSACLGAPHGRCRGAVAARSDSCRAGPAAVERLLWGPGLLRAPAHAQVIPEGAFHEHIQGRSFLLESLLSSACAPTFPRLSLLGMETQLCRTEQGLRLLNHHAEDSWEPQQVPAPPQPPDPASITFPRCPGPGELLFNPRSPERLPGRAGPGAGLGSGSSGRDGARAAGAAPGWDSSSSRAVGREGGRQR